MFNKVTEIIAVIIGLVWIGGMVCSFLVNVMPSITIFCIGCSIWFILTCTIFSLVDLLYTLIPWRISGCDNAWIIPVAPVAFLLPAIIALKVTALIPHHSWFYLGLILAGVILWIIFLAPRSLVRRLGRGAGVG